MATKALTYTSTPPTMHYTLYGAHQPSPANSSGSSNNISPTSPRTMNPFMPPQMPPRQLRPMKVPLYVPAVLRPTERPPRQTPLTPPRSLHGSMDSIVSLDGGKVGPRRATGDQIDHSKLVEEEWDGDEYLGQVTGPPTREHWKARIFSLQTFSTISLTFSIEQSDSSSPTCDSPNCDCSFTLFVRRHHCRHCGRIYCSQHSLFTVRLDQNARFHYDGTHSRACDECWDAYKRWETSRCARKRGASLDAGIASLAPSPVVGMNVKGFYNINNNSNGGKPKAAAAASVPKDWNWSTF
ncbi:MAG: hypothetical protein M1834_005967 [Cirrosporium novae-zelandiae]|nr:MAG: hypothetical protein M1834_005967 [Cirrosporium novae-zelandiae]